MLKSCLSSCVLERRDNVFSRTYQIESKQNSILSWVTRKTSTYETEDRSVEAERTKEQPDNAVSTAINEPVTVERSQPSDCVPDEAPVTVSQLANQPKHFTFPTKTLVIFDSSVYTSTREDMRRFVTFA